MKRPLSLRKISDDDLAPGSPHLQWTILNNGAIAHKTGWRSMEGNTHV
jgi:hypothetical protein